MSGNRTLLIVGVVLILCLCVALISIGAGIYFVSQGNSLTNPLTNATLVPPTRIVVPITPQAGIALPAPGEVCSKVEEFDDQGYDHIRVNEPHPPYNSNPPTSGWHWANPQEWGIYSVPQVQEQLVHNLEHGGIVIQHNNLSAAELQRLLQFARNNPRHIVVAPYPGLSGGAKIAWTAWTYMQMCTGVDTDALQDFIDEFRDQGPESVP